MEYTVEEIMQVVNSYKDAALDKAKKDLAEIDVSSILEGALSVKTSSNAIGEMLLLFNKAENIVYDLSLIRLDLKVFGENLPSTGEYSTVGKSVAKALVTISDCLQLATKRYDHISSVLTGVRSINTNFRTAGVKNINHI